MPPILLPQWLFGIPSLPLSPPSSAKATPDLGRAILTLFDRAVVVPSNVYVTLSITRPETTYTTTILLAGTGTGGAVVTPVPIATTTTAAPVFTTTVTDFSTPTAQVISAAPTSTDPTSTTIIGAIVGSIVGSFLLIFFWWLFCARGLFWGGSRSRGSSIGSTRSDSL